MLRRLMLVLLFPLCANGAILEHDRFRVHHDASTAALARETAQTLTDARIAFADRFPDMPDIVDVYICEDQESFQQFAGPLTAASIVGVANPDTDVIALKSPSFAPPQSDYIGTVRHELVHILLHHNVNTDNVPRWLNEGIAMTVSGENRWSSRSHVAFMYLNGRTLSYRSLEASFLEPGQELEFGDAYAQAMSMTQYLQKQLGEEQFWEFVYSLNDRSFGVAVEAELGLIPHDFALAWAASLGWTALVFSLVSGVSLFQIMALLTIAAYLRRRRQAQARMAAWAVAESKEDAVSAET